MNPAIDETHDPERTSWVASADGHADFPIQNLPLGMFSPPGGQPRGGVAIGDSILDLSLAAGASALGDVGWVASLASGPTLNPLLARPAEDRRALRRRLSAILGAGSRHRSEAEGWLHEAATCALHLPARIGDYTDFYAGIHHAMNVGRQFRPDQPLLPNYKYVPIGYHGRASSVRVSGAPVRRPCGQRKAPDAEAPDFGPSRRLDIELELGVWIGPGSSLGEPIAIHAARDHIAGLTLLNDWSARDIQAWEYQPLGPFLAKNFMTTVSPWIVTAEALAPFQMPQPPRPDGDPAPLPHLLDTTDQASGAYDLDLGVFISTARMRAAGMAPHRLSSGSSRHLYWTLAQLVAHHTSGGCDLNPGDLLGTGTISTPDDTGLGSLMEMTRGAARPLALPDGETRSFLEDGDEITLTAQARAEGFVGIGFGPCVGRVEAARGPVSK
jgi:fumarylacetoacetase